MSRLIESISLRNGVFENLRAHQRRVVDSIHTCFGGPPRWSLDEVVSQHQLPTSGWHKVRLVYDDRSATVTIGPYAIRPVSTLRLVFDDTIEYQYKFEDRTRINRLFENRGEADDILIIRNGFVTDTSYANIVFRSREGWFTPTTFLLNGTMRQTLLDSGRISAVPIRVEDLARYSHFKLINALLQEEGTESDVSNIR